MSEDSISDEITTQRLPWTPRCSSTIGRKRKKLNGGKEQREKSERGFHCEQMEIIPRGRSLRSTRLRSSLIWEDVRMKGGLVEVRRACPTARRLVQCIKVGWHNRILGGVGLESTHRPRRNLDCPRQRIVETGFILDTSSRFSSS